MTQRKKSEEIADAILADPSVSNQTLAKRIGVSKSNIQHYRNSSETLNIIRERLARDGGATGAARSAVGDLLGALSVATDRLLSADLADDETVSRALQLLAGLTGTLERMSRAGIDLSAVSSAEDNRALSIEIIRAYSRGMATADRFGPRTRARMLARLRAWLATQRTL